MPVFDIDSVEILPSGKINITSGKITYSYGDIDAMHAFASKDVIKSTDKGLIAACNYILNQQNINGISNSKVPF